MPGPSAGSDPKYDKRTINMLANMSTRERNKFVRENASVRSGGGGMKGLAKDARTAAKTARKAGDKDTAKTARKLARKADRTVARRKARRAVK